MLALMELYWADAISFIHARLLELDKRMQQHYELEAKLPKFGVVHVFEKGERILLKQRRIGKMFPKSAGPMIFVRYTGVNGLTAVVRNTAMGRLLDCSTSHLVLLR